MSRTGIPSVLATALRERTEWDEAPCLYAMYRAPGGVALHPVMAEADWPEGEPVDVLAALAASAGSALITTTPDFTGLAFRAEVWGRRRGEQRWMWAVGTGGERYLAAQTRDDGEVYAGEQEAESGRVYRVLEQLVRSVMAGAS